MKVGIKQISEQSGFSQATVSNVLNNKKKTNKQTSEKILRVARELGYRRELLVRSVSLVLCKKHGDVLGDTPFFGALIDGVGRGCNAYGPSENRLPAQLGANQQLPRAQLWLQPRHDRGGPAPGR